MIYAAIRLLLPRLPKRISSNVIPGVETELDRVFLAHFHDRMSKILTVSDNKDTNLFQRLIIPMACTNKCLMHSLLALSGSHLIRCSPTESFAKPKEWHYTNGLSILVKEVTLTCKYDKAVEEPIVATMIFQCLITISEGRTNGEHHIHLDGAYRYIKFQQNSEFGVFVRELYTYYYNMSNMFTSSHRPEADSEDLGNGICLPVPASSATFPDKRIMTRIFQLFKFMRTIKSFRSHARARKVQGTEPWCDSFTYDQATKIRSCLYVWQTGENKGTQLDITTEIYREAILVYLLRSVRMPGSDLEVLARVNRAMKYIQTLPPNGPVLCVLLLPLFILGCAAFKTEQRIEIEYAFNKLERYSRLGNIVPARQVVHRIWEMMDVEDKESWDWETVMQNMNYDFLIA